MIRVALSGAFGYSLAPFLSDRYRFEDAVQWFGFKVDAVAEWLRLLATVSGEPIVLVGFSAGANAALEISQQLGAVVEVIAHSPGGGFHPIGYRPDLRVRMFRTIGDRTPSWGGTERMADRYRRSGYPVEFREFQPEPWADGFRPRWTDWQYRAAQALNHHFHNCLRAIPEHR